MDLLKVPRIPYKKRLHNKIHLNLTTEALGGFSPGVSNRLCVTHSKSSNNGNLEPKSGLIIFSLNKVILKARVILPPQTVERKHSIFKFLLKLWLSSHAFEGKHSVLIFFRWP